MTLSDFTRWLYRGQQPNWMARIMNGATAALASTGIAANYLETLEVTGRKSGRIFSLPVVLAVVDGQRYLVSMLGDNVSWVQNVRAASGRAVLRSGGREKVQLEEVPAEQRAPILKVYLRRAPGARPHLSVKKDATLAQFQTRHFRSSGLLLTRRFSFRGTRSCNLWDNDWKRKQEPRASESDGTPPSPRALK